MLTKLFKKNKFLGILLLFLIWRIGLFIVGALAQKFFVYDPSFPYADAILARFDLPQWLFSWGNFDGVHYLTIADQGYKTTGLIQAFFPTLPILIYILNLLIGNMLVTSLLISNFLFLIFLYVWYLFIEQRFSQKVALLSTIIILLFPSSFFFGAIYNESLFLLAVILSFWFAEKKQYYLTALFIALASSTRIVGIFLIPAIITEIIFSNFSFSDFLSAKISKNKAKLEKMCSSFKKSLLSIKKKLAQIGIILLGSLGLISYMLYLYYQFGDPLYFFHVQSEFGGIRQESLITYPQVVYRYIKILLTVRPFNLSYFASVQEFIVAIFGLLLILYSFTKVKLSYFIFALSAFILPTMTGTFSSMPRYILVSFPIFIVLANWSEKSTVFRYVWLIFSAILLILNTMLFVQGYWIG